ncbi:Gustatory receptor 55, partial [Halyomorpha halys]
MSQVISQGIQSNFIFTASSLLGIFPFRVIEKNLKVDNYLLIYSLIISSFLTIITLYFIWTDIYPAGAVMIPVGRSFNFHITLFTFICQSLWFILFFVSFYFSRNALVETVNTLDTLEPIFRKLEGKVKKLSIQKKSWLEALIVPLVCGTAFHMWGNTRGKMWAAIGYMSVLILTSLSCWQFNCLVNTISDFFQSSSKFLTRIKLNPLKSLASLKELIDAYDQLITTLDKINVIYSKKLIMIIANCYVCSLLHIYYLYCSISSNDRWQHPQIRGNVIMSLLHVYVMWRLIHSTTQANHK